MNKKIYQRKILPEIGKCIIKTMNQTTLKLIQKLNGKSWKIVCNYNCKLRGPNTYTHWKEVKNNKNINIKSKMVFIECVQT